MFPSSASESLDLCVQDLLEISVPGSVSDNEYTFSHNHHIR